MCTQPVNPALWFVAPWDLLIGGSMGNLCRASTRKACAAPIWTVEQPRPEGYGWACCADWTVLGHGAATMPAKSRLVLTPSCDLAFAQRSRRNPLPRRALAILFALWGATLARAGETLIRVDKPMPPPGWAVLERELLRANARACEEYF